MKGIAERDDAQTLGFAFGEKVTPSELQRGLDGLRARVAKKRPVHPRQATQRLRQAHVRLVEKIIRDVQKLRGLRCNRSTQLRVPVTERADGDAGVQIQIALA